MTALIRRLLSTVFWALSYLPLQKSAPRHGFQVTSGDLSWPDGASQEVGVPFLS